MVWFILTFLPVISFLAKSFLVYAQEATVNECQTLPERREWRALNDSQKADYITAVKCLQSQPAQQPMISAARTRFDEFQALHVYVADGIHSVGQFLPWHRFFLKIYEDILRNECGYKGAVPYWDWSIDADKPGPLLDSPIFNPKTGFGGTGVPGTYTLPPDPDGSHEVLVPESYVGCVEDGPFASYRLQLGPGKFITDHCLVRGPTFELFRIELEGTPITPTPKMHDGGHIGVGGDLSNIYSSPGDALFYLHHANLDRIWWNWQQVDSKRLYEISGRSTTSPPYGNVTLDFGLYMGNFAQTIPIRDVMDIHRGPMCYTYD